MPVEASNAYVQYVHPPVDAKPTFAIVEILERTGPGGHGVDESVPAVVPTEVKVNGQSLYTSAEHPIRVESIETGGSSSGNLVEVTLTLIARRVVIAHEDDLPGVAK
jgi:hypothetical protein